MAAVDCPYGQSAVWVDVVDTVVRTVTSSGVLAQERLLWYMVFD